MSTITDYVPLEVQLLKDAEKYIARATIYLADGKLKHSAGCLMKAAKKMEQSDKFKIDCSFLIPAMNLLAKNIAAQILKGS